jgi:endonuclease-3 related protein
MNVQAVHDRLLDHYGPQAWWPADDAFEMMLGAILTQNTNWTNVEHAIANLRDAGLLDAQAITDGDEVSLARAIRPSGYFNQKGKKLKVLAEFYLAHGGKAGIDRLPDARQALLELHGIGPETADSILLYALHRPVFVIDAYTRRIFARLGATPPDASYDTLQDYFQSRLPLSAPLFNEYHALIVMHAKQHCRPRPACSGCPLQQECAYPRRAGHGSMQPTHLTV